MCLNQASTRSSVTPSPSSGTLPYRRPSCLPVGEAARSPSSSGEGSTTPTSETSWWERYSACTCVYVQFACAKFYSCVTSLVYNTRHSQFTLTLPYVTLASVIMAFIESSRMLSVVLVSCTYVQACLPLAKLCAMVTMQKTASANSQFFSLPLKEVTHTVGPALGTSKQVSTCITHVVWGS